jgi:exonuclease III
MKRSIIYAVAMLLIFSSFVLADGPLKNKDQEDSLLTFLEGSYKVIGKYPDGGGTYAGAMILTRKDNELQITRNIKGKKTTGSAKVITVTADEITVLHADFTQGKDKLKAIYIISTDLDNFARLTGKVYFVGRETKNPGIEALFVLSEP